MAYTVSPVGNHPERVLVVGCGGTGSFVADGLCRLLINNGIDILLADHDRVEPHNIGRQQFFPDDVGKFKSQVLAERLARQYNRSIGYSIWPYSHELLMRNMGGRMSLSVRTLIIGCVDSAAARKDIATDLQALTWWIDSGNGYSSGQVLIGNACKGLGLQRCFSEEHQMVKALPLPSVQLPSLLIPPTIENGSERDCAESIIAEEQSPVINHAMATLILEFTYRFLSEKLMWMGAYIDLDAGTLQTVPADPKVVARMLGVKVDTLMEYKGNNKKR